MVSKIRVIICSNLNRIWQHDVKLSNNCILMPSNSSKICSLVGLNPSNCLTNKYQSQQQFPYYITIVSNQFVSCSKGITIELTTSPNHVASLMLSKALEDTVCINNLSCYEWVELAMMPEEE